MPESTLPSDRREGLPKGPDQGPDERPDVSARSGKDQAIVFILNGSAGDSRTDEAREAILRIAGAVDAPVQIHTTRNGGDIADLVRLAVEQGARLVVAGGGDGTVSAVASGLVESEAALGVLPLGTLNHFAKDTGIPLDIDAAVQNVLDGHLTTVDVGEVNGRIFLNNSSIGLYPRIVRYREADRVRGHTKWVAFARAILAALRRHSLFHVRLSSGDGGQTISRKTAFVFVGNNEYEMKGARIGARNDLATGRLWVCLPRHGGRLDLLRLALRALFGRIGDKDLHILRTREVVIETSKRRSGVATDGEVVAMAAPLTYRIRPRSLKVIVPDSAAAPAAG
jgi:YegS/Rv2252/BmrU family lipid kinase